MRGRNLPNKTIFLILLFLFSFVPLVNASSFDVGSLLIKVSLNKGKVASKAITITSQDSGDFEASIVGVKGVSLKESYFSLQSGQTKTLDLTFDSKNLAPGVYVGSVKISSGRDSSFIPIIFEIDSEDVFFKASVDIPPQYNKINPGEKLLAQLKIFDLTSGGTNDGLGTTHLTVEYRIYTIDGSVIVSDIEDVIVDRQAQLTKTFSFPKEVKEDDYILAVITNYKSSTTVSTNIFSIGATSTGSFFDFESSSSGGLLLIIGAIFAFFLVVIGLFIYFVRDRDRMLFELRSYHQGELRRMRGFLLAQEKLISQTNRAAVPAVHKEVQHKLEHLKKMHLQREKHFKVLKSQGNFAGMRHKLEEWKAKGYNTLALEYKLKGLKSRDMESLLSYWKRNYTAKSIKTDKGSSGKR